MYKGDTIGESIISNIYFDSLTRMPNLFRFIEGDTNELFGKEGSAVLIDIINFINVNDEYGRETGDFVLKTLAKCIREILKKHNDSSVFRTGGDEFTIVFPNCFNVDVEKIILEIKSDFKERLNDYGYSNIDFHYLIMKYEDSINTIDEFYQLLYKYTLNKIENNYENIYGKQWTSHIIISFTRRIEESLKLLNKAYNLALTDDVSSLPNNRAANRYLEDLIIKSKKNEKSFSVLFIDGDNLKRYNKISYNAGNEMIRDLSTIIKNSLRKQDKVFRWLSGDEFLVVLNEVDYEDARKLAERVRKTVENETKGWTYPVTVSIGVSNYPIDGGSIEELVHKSEKANTHAKSSGKNRVVYWDALKIS